MGTNPSGTGPSRLWYGVGGALLAAAVIGGILLAFWAVTRTIDRVREFQRIGIPGTEDVRLGRAGSYTIYYEGPGINEGDDDDPRPSLEVSLQRLDDGAFIPLRQYGGRFTYDIDEHHGLALFTFRSPGPGAYRFQARADLAPGRAQLALGPSITGGLLREAIVGGMVCFLAFVGGVVVLVVTAVRRSQARRPPRPQTAPYPPHPQPPPPPPGPPPPPPPPAARM